MQKATNLLKDIFTTKKYLPILIGVGFLSVIVASILLISKPESANADNPQFAKYISAHTNGKVSRNSGIKIVFNTELSQKLMDVKDNLSSILTFKPQIDGHFDIEDNTVFFVPTEYLPSGKQFIGVFDLSKIASVPKGLEEFRFEFFTIAQNMEVQVLEQKTIDKKKLRWQSLSGELRIADYEKPELIKKTLSATINGKPLNIKWLTEFEETTFSFEVDSIPREEKDSKLILAYNGQEIGVSKKDQIEVRIPSYKTFELISNTVVNTQQQYIMLQFSDPLSTNQDFAGLVSMVSPANANISFSVEDNVLKVFAVDVIKGSAVLQISSGIKNILGFKLGKQERVEVVFEDILPGVRWVKNGNILPTSEKGLIVPFEAVNLSAVDIRVIKIFENNVTQFLQVNDLDQDTELKRVGLPVVSKTIRLDQYGVTDMHAWNRYTLDLNELMTKEPGAIYRVEIGFRKKYSLYNCAESEETVEEVKKEENWGANDEKSYWDSWDGYYSWYGEYNYDEYWENLENPCHPAFYTKSERRIAQNLIASNLGLIAKKGADGSFQVIVTDIRTTKPISGVEIQALNYQQQLIKSAATTSDGFAFFPQMESPFMIVAKHGNERGYLKVNDELSLSLSKFDVAGTAVSKGMKGNIYGERGVWRPGDSLFLTFVLKEPEAGLPNNHPVVMELKDPLGKVSVRQVQQYNKTGFYAFHLKTNDDAPTGNWQAKVSVGGAEFSQPLKIETIKPNRLKINMKLEREPVTNGELNTAKISAAWLHGGIAKDLDVKVEVAFSKAETKFTGYSDYTFEDPMKFFSTEPSSIFEGKLDNEGNTNFNLDLKAGETSPGKLNATFLTRVFESGGDFSIDRYQVAYNPFGAYVGIKLPKGDKARGMLLTDTAHEVDIVLLDANGKKLAKSGIVKLEFFKLNWEWWWEEGNNWSNYQYSDAGTLLATQDVKLNGGQGKWKIRVNYPDWGRYMVRATDTEGGHACAKVVYIDWPGWAGREQKDHGAGASLLSFTSDKQKYNVGEVVQLTIPSGEGSRALVSIENGSKILETHWLETQKGQTNFSFKVTKEMTPNIYVNVTMIQPHAQTLNDLPIRLYGILPLMIENPETHLYPEITVPEVVRPETPFTVTVNEKSKRKMTYTLAIVDEGLLDLTRYKTPDLWNKFYAKEALGVKSWDIYDYVIGAFGGKLDRLLSIGGDESPIDNNSKKRANRFIPVVKYLGPFEYDGNTQSHTIKLPAYIGAVKVMLVAGKDNAYGSVDKSVFVRKPLMVLASLPRVLGPGESVKLPVTLFAMEKNIKSVKLQVKTNKLLRVMDGEERTINFSQPGEEDAYFNLDVAAEIGVGEVEVIATSGNEKAVYKIELDIRNPNPKVTEVLSSDIISGSDWTTTFTPIGISGTNTVTLEVSNLMPFNLQKNARYLIQYPHGCIEQTTSAAFAQLTLDKFMELKAKQKTDIQKNIKAAITRLSSFQLASGGFSYWPGEGAVSDWGTTYAGHFLIEAQKRGYTVPGDMFKKWKKYQHATAKIWSGVGSRGDIDQAYRLYTLALTGEEELAQMNRLKEEANLSIESKWKLAAAYHLSGKKDVAKLMTQNLSTDVKPYTELSYTFGSDLRDKAIIVEALVLTGDRNRALPLVQELCRRLDTEFYSTQSVAYSLIALADYSGADKRTPIKYSYSLNGGKSEEIVNSTMVSQVEIPVNSINSGRLEVKNSSGQVLFARLIMEGVPSTDNTADAFNQLNMEVKYLNMKGEPIAPEKIEQGTDFFAEVTLLNNYNRGDLAQMALTQIFPSGWEIINTRMLDIETFSSTSTATYQDFRDDRIYTYYDLKKVTKNPTRFRVMLNATYLGKFYLPAVYSEAMYDRTVNARIHGRWVEVVGIGDI